MVMQFLKQVLCSAAFLVVCSAALLVVPSVLEAQQVPTTGLPFPAAQRLLPSHQTPGRRRTPTRTSAPALSGWSDRTKN